MLHLKYRYKLKHYLKQLTSKKFRMPLFVGKENMGMLLVIFDRKNSLSKEDFEYLYNTLKSFSPKGMVGSSFSQNSTIFSLPFF